MFLYFPAPGPEPSTLPPLPEERLAILVRRWWRWLTRATWRSRRRFRVLTRRRRSHPLPAALRPGAIP
ncbi:MAG: hypothetical protein RLZZ127_1244 [Planctomycetota bacterium]|jgi:site-specific recombinase XerD